MSHSLKREHYHIQQMYCGKWVIPLERRSWLAIFGTQTLISWRFLMAHDGSSWLSFWRDRMPCCNTPRDITRSDITLPESPSLWLNMFPHSLLTWPYLRFLILRRILECWQRVRKFEYNLPSLNLQQRYRLCVYSNFSHSFSGSNGRLLINGVNDISKVEKTQVSFNNSSTNAKMIGDIIKHSSGRILWPAALD